MPKALWRRRCTHQGVALSLRTFLVLLRLGGFFLPTNLRNSQIDTVSIILLESAYLRALRGICLLVRTELRLAATANERHFPVHLMVPAMLGNLRAEDR